MSPPLSAGLVSSPPRARIRASVAARMRAHIPTHAETRKRLAGVPVRLLMRQGTRERGTRKWQQSSCTVSRTWGAMRSMTAAHVSRWLTGLYRGPNGRTSAHAELSCRTCARGIVQTAGNRTGSSSQSRAASAASTSSMTTRTGCALTEARPIAGIASPLSDAETRRDARLARLAT